MYRTSAVTALGVVLTSSLSAAHPARNGDSLEIDFEAPLYQTGSINNQDGWSSLGSIGRGCALYDVAVVDDALYRHRGFGSQSLRMSNAVVSSCFSDQTFSKPLANEAGEAAADNGGLSGGVRRRHFEAEWRFASTDRDFEQPGLQIVASPDRGDGARMSWIQMADAPAGLEVNVYDYQSGLAAPGCDGDNFVFTNVASGLKRDRAHTLKIVIDFVDGPANDVVRIFVDGRLRHRGTTWEDFYRECDPVAGQPLSRTVDSMLFRAGGAPGINDAPHSLGKGFVVDNLSLTTQSRGDDDDQREHHGEHDDD